MTQIDLSIEGGYELLDGKKIPRIAYGTCDIGEGEAATRAVCEAIGAGCRLIDCARFYGNEREVGKALAAEELAEIDALNRHEYILAQVSPADFSMLDGTSSHFE